MTRLDYWNARAAQTGYDARYFVQVEGQWLPVIAGGKGGKTTVTSVVNIPPATDEEKALQKTQVHLLDLQVKQAERQTQLLEESFPTSSALLKEQLGLTRQLVAQLQPSETTQTEKDIKTLSDQRALSILKGEAPPLSSQQESFINDTFKSAETEAKTSLRSFAEELAASRGLKLSDSPIGDTALREESRLAGSLAGAKATAKLDVSQTQQAFQEGVRQFQENLRQQAFLNRVALTGGFPNVGAATLVNAPQSLTLPSVTNANILDRLMSQRFALASTTRTGVGPGSGFDLGGTGSIIGGSGALVGGGAALFSAIKASTARLKRDITPLDETESTKLLDGYENARRTVAEMPIARWRYKWERDEDREPHIGPILEASPPEIREDSTHLNLGDMAGLALAAIKGVDRRVDRLEARLPVGTRGRLPVSGRVVERRPLPVGSAA